MAVAGGRWNGCIDVHHHFYPPAYLAALPPDMQLPQLMGWSPARTLEEMDANGVATAILSLSPPGTRDPALARACNEYAARLAADRPGRFGFFAAVPMPDVDATLAEIAYALDVLKADGIGLMSSYTDRWPGDPAFDPVFAELDRRRANCYVHPAAPACCLGLMAWVPTPVLEFTFDTTRAIVSLMFSGTLARYPNIRFTFSHGGGTLPMLAGRIGSSVMNGRFLDFMPQGVEHELAKLHYDLAIAASPPSLAALLTLAPASQVLMGSDFPYHSIARVIEGLEATALDAGAREAIRRSNAERLIPRLRRES